MADKVARKIELPITVGDMLRKLEEEIGDVKDGVLPLDTARVVQRGRALQLKAAELNVQYARMNKAERRNGREYNLLTGAHNIATEDKPI
jgi:hypothetical protein